MSYSEFLPFLLTAIAVGFIYIKRSRSRERKYTAYEIEPAAAKSIFIERPCGLLKEELKKRLKDQGLTVHAEEESRVVFDSPKIGAFHWGFLYTLDFKEQGSGTLVTFGIFGKGPNPPRRKTQESYLNEFINSRIHE